MVLSRAYVGEEMPELVSAKRKNDAVIQVTKRGSAADLIVTHLNRAAEQLLGSKAEMILGKKINSLLEQELQEALLEEEEENLPALFRHFTYTKIKNSSDKRISVAIKVFDLPSLPQVHNYEFLLHDLSLLENLHSLKDSIRQSQAQTKNKDALTNLPDGQFLEICLREISRHKAKKSIDVALVNISLAPFENIFSSDTTAEDCALFLASVQNLNEGLRSEDVLISMGKEKFSLLLIDCTAADAVKNVLPRLQQRFLKKPIQDARGNKIPVKILAEVEAL
jgi:GGDEF domain-containing protein